MAPRNRHETYLAALPGDWTTRRIDEVGAVVGGSTPRRGVLAFWAGTIPWVTPGELTALPTKYLEGTREQITAQGLASCGAQLLPPDSLLVTSRATVGAVALNRNPTATNQGFKSVVCKADQADPHYLYHL